MLWQGGVWGTVPDVSMTWNCVLELCWSLCHELTWALGYLKRGVHGRWMCYYMSASRTLFLLGRQVPVTGEDITLQPPKALGKVGFSPGSVLALVQVKASRLQSISGLCIPEWRRLHWNHRCAWMACLCFSLHKYENSPFVCMSGRVL